MITEKECLHFLFCSGNSYDRYGNGYGNSYDSNRNGVGYGYGYGDGYGNGNGYGNGYGYGYGYCNGNEDDSNGYGDGYDTSNGNIDGDGDGFGKGDGNGDDDGYGYGYGDGNFNMPHPYYKIDKIWCEILHIKGNYAKINIIDMYNVDNCMPAYIAKDGGQFAHGKTLREARESLIYKIGNRDTGYYKDWKLTDIKPAAEIIKAYRVITGACEFGTKSFVQSRELPKNATISDAIELTYGQYGNNQFAEFFSRKAKK